MDGVKKTTEDYIKYFEPMAYLQRSMTPVDGGKDDVDITTWCIEQLHETFAKGTIKAERMLDVGTGPSILSVISAAPHCDNIFLSEVVPQSREVLHQWLSNTLSHSFQPFFKFIVDKEGKGESPTERESELRKKVVGILPIDVLKNQPLEPCFFSKFQLITTCLCLGSAANDVPAYEDAVRNVDGLIEEGGHIVFVGIINDCPYKVGAVKFGPAKLTKEETTGIWERLGYDIVEYKEHRKKLYCEEKYVHGGYCLLVARKSCKGSS